MTYDRDRVEYLLGQEKTEEVVEELIVLNFGLMQTQLNKFYLYDDPDALSFAYESLYKAIMTYDKSTNHKFSTYATVCIYNRLGSYVRSLNSQIASNTVYYEEPVGDGSLTFLDTLESRDTADGKLIDDCGVSEVVAQLRDCIGELKNPLHYLIVNTWIESEFNLTHSKIAEELNCTQSYVSQTIKAFKNKLKKKLGES
jgi:RNA polymerase sigma factor (sigma-70 family)